MGKVIKKGNTELGDINPDTGFADLSAQRRAPVISRSTAEAKSEAALIRERAEQQADEIVKQAEIEAEQLKANAFNQGYEEGKNAAAAELSEVVASSSRRLQQIEAQAEPQLRDLAVKIARKIIGKELEFAPEAVVDVVKQALSEKARQRREIFLRVHPDDLQLIRESKAELIEILSRAKEIGIREDKEISRGGVVIETDAGTIDAQIDTQLEVFEKVLMETR
jgi:flagellar biosynthesis/type III secretory pathway protein FliH